MTVQSDRAGYVYIAMAGSDNQALHLLFPNDLDQDNTIKAGQSLRLPRPNWRVKAGGPAGTDNLLVMVTDGPRDVAALAASANTPKAGPFVASLNDAQGRAQLGALMSHSQGLSASKMAREMSSKAQLNVAKDYDANILLKTDDKGESMVDKVVFVQRKK